MLFMLLVASNLRSAPITLSYLLETTTLPVCEQLRSAALHVLLKSSPLLPRVWHVHSALCVNYKPPSEDVAGWVHLPPLLCMEAEIII